jgi:hypothetical protein
MLRFCSRKWHRIAVWSTPAIAAPLVAEGASLPSGEFIKYCLASTTFTHQRQLFLPINDNYNLDELVMV